MATTTIVFDEPMPRSQLHGDELCPEIWRGDVRAIGDNGFKLDGGWKLERYIFASGHYQRFNQSASYGINNGICWNQHNTNQHVYGDWEGGVQGRTAQPVFSYRSSSKLFTNRKKQSKHVYHNEQQRVWSRGFHAGESESTNSNGRCGFNWFGIYRHEFWASIIYSKLVKWYGDYRRGGSCDQFLGSHNGTGIFNGNAGKSGGDGKNTTWDFIFNADFSRCRGSNDSDLSNEFLCVEWRMFMHRGSYRFECCQYAITNFDRSRVNADRMAMSRNRTNWRSMRRICGVQSDTKMIIHYYMPDGWIQTNVDSFINEAAAEELGIISSDLSGDGLYLRATVSDNIPYFNKIRLAAIAKDLGATDDISE